MTDGMDWSVEVQEEAARRLWQQAIGPSALFRYCRHVLGMDVNEATDGPLLGIITSRRLRRVEKGEEDIPPRAWQVYADMLIEDGRPDLAERVACVCPSVELQLRLPAY